MPQEESSDSQVQFLTQWFDSWSEMKKEDFIPIIAQALNPENHENGLIGGVESLSVSGRRPSLFDCQIKLFHEWFITWSEANKTSFLHHVRENDSEFTMKLDKYMDNAERSSSQCSEQLHVDLELSGKDDSVVEDINTPPSQVTASSSVSSLSLSQSHDE